MKINLISDANKIGKKDYSIVGLDFIRMLCFFYIFIYDW